MEKGIYNLNTRYGQLFVLPQDQNYIYVDHYQNNEDRRLIVNGVELMTSARMYRWPDGKWHVGEEKDTAYERRQALDVRRKNSSGFYENTASESAREKIKTELEIVVTKWADQNPRAFWMAELLRLGQQIDNLMHDVKDATIRLEKQQAELIELRIKRNKIALDFFTADTDKE